MAREQFPDGPRDELRPPSGRQRTARHALVVGPEVEVEEVESLALSRFPAHAGSSRPMPRRPESCA